MIFGRKITEQDLINRGQLLINEMEIFLGKLRDDKIRDLEARVRELEAKKLKIKRQ